MLRKIVDHRKLTPEILQLLMEKYPDGYGDNDIITFEDHHNHVIEAVEVKTDDTVYLVKIHSKLHYTMTNFDQDTPIEVINADENAGMVTIDDDE
ncbi:hypothetical protein ACFQ1M_08060 [Sungkyunkwania multivorans]|uniref:Uncharacterized protein n=1 Tax=Sungkyunkwania multivorans TaxID=1173618 RepID=A0ABW3CWL1_9FLAO